MRILFVGDVVGRSGRTKLLAEVADLRRALKLDALVVNGENAAGGYGITAKLAAEFLDAGVDLITLGNHAWDQRDLIGRIDQEPRIIRPSNMQPGTPGKGSGEMRTARGKRLVVIQVLGRLFMHATDDPFRTIEGELARRPLRSQADAILIDVHAEATSEKLAIGHAFDGRVSAVLGTHTHVPTADHVVLPGGTAYMSDVGMTGDYDSVIGMNKDLSVQRWRSDIPTQKLEPADGEATLCAAYIETDDATGLAKRIVPIRRGGRLEATPLPEPA